MSDPVLDIRHIVVPVDFTTCSALVVGQAASLARRLDARLLLLHVAEVPSGLDPDAIVRPQGVPVRAGEWALSGARAPLEGMAAEARHHGVEPTLELRIGPVVDTILAVAEERAADLVILGTHARKGLARVVLGSVAEEVARRSPCPVMLVRREVRAECGRASCDWCTLRGRSAAEDQLDGEIDG